MAGTKKPTSQALADNAPWKPAEFDDAVAAAIQAMANGMATADQQKRAMAWIVEKCCRTYDMSYRPGGPESERDTIFAEGSRFVGLQIVKVAKVKIGLLQPRRSV